MDKLVRRVTVVQGGGENRHATIAYERDRDDDHDDDDSEGEAWSFFRPLERAIRHMLKAEVIMAQEAYNRHIKSAAHGRHQWLLDMPSNVLNAQRKGLKEIRRAARDVAHEDEGD